MISSRRADALFIFITIIWGLTFPVIRNSLHFINPSAFVALRFIIASLIFFPFIIARLKRTTKIIFFSGAILGVLNGFGYYSQTIGLKTIGSAESAFITSLTVIFIPFLLPLFKLRRPKLIEWIAALICLFGVYELTGAKLTHINPAYLWTLIVAITTAINVVYLQKVSHRIGDFVLFAFYQILFAGFIPILSMIIHHQYQVQWTGRLIFYLLYCASIATVLTFFIQSRFQQYTSPARVGIIFCLEPVFASFFAYMISGELITRTIFIGGAIILFSLLMVSLPFFTKLNDITRFKKRNQDQPR
jgi:drug/metabolite transporter (DMT)-like permease